VAHLLIADTEMNPGPALRPCTGGSGEGRESVNPTVVFASSSARGVFPERLVGGPGRLTIVPWGGAPRTIHWKQRATFTGALSAAMLLDYRLHPCHPRHRSGRHGFG